MQRKRKNKPQKQKFSNLDNDFMFGGNGAVSNANVYRDFYGGRSRYKGCQKRVLRVSFRDLNWQVRERFRSNFIHTNYIHDFLTKDNK